jgi:Tol biopolymer transport system component
MKIAFSSERDGNVEIYVMNADGTNQVRLTSNGAIDERPSWSPDGTKITFWSNRDGNREIYVMNADGSVQMRLTNNPAVDQTSPWSPEGTRIAFESDRDGNFEIYTMNTDGSGQTRLTNNAAFDQHPSWLPFRRIGSSSVGTPVSRTMTIENKGSATLTVSNITSSDGQFTASPTNFSVNAGASQNVR